jgi:hypothetical protein
MTYPQYRYLLIDLIAPYPVIGELQFTSVTWSRVLNSNGEFSGSININDPRTLTNIGTQSGGYTSSMEYITQPGRVGLYVERNNEIVWGGIVWTRQWDTANQSLTIGAQTFGSYFDRRIVQDVKTLSGALVFLDTTDQFQVMVGPNGVLDNMDSATQTLANGTIISGDIGIDYDTAAVSGVTLPGVYVVYDYEHKKVSDVLSDTFAQSVVENDATGSTYQLGFDWDIEVYYDATNALRRTFTQYYPTKGNTDRASNILPTLEFPGSIISYTWPEDGTSMCTLVHGIGPGTGEGNYTTYASPQVGFVQTGYPMLEDTESFTSIPSPNTVDALAQAKADVRSAPVVTPSFVWSPGWQFLQASNIEATVGPAIGEFRTGDVFRIRLNDSRFLNGAEYFLRLTEFTVSVGDSGEGELVTGSFSLQTY